MTTPIGITMGDPAGIGPEIVVKLAEEKGGIYPFVVVGDLGSLERSAEQLGSSLRFRAISKVEDFRASTGVVDVISVGQVRDDLPLGEISAEAGRASYSYVERAVQEAMAGQLAAIVTAPINKAALRAAGIRHPGHTEILAALTGTTDYTMMMASDELRVVLVTIHESLRSAIDRIDAPLILRVIHLAAGALSRMSVDRPRIGVAGLNPHAGENGLMGREEVDIIAPAVEQAQSAGIDASGPYPPDTVFMRARNGDFDAVIALYHDQGLIPFKYLGLDKGTNVTIGLPFVRTSVDHGTAFDIVGKNVADHRSLRVAIDQAVALTDPH